jgi:large subunit ribosomal protein L31
VRHVKKEIHPVYHSDAKIVCACGAVYEVGSTKQSQKIEICSKCHPFYTGHRRIVDTDGRVERFIKKYKWGAEPAQEKKGPKVKKGAEEVQEILEELEAADAAKAPTAGAAAEPAKKKAAGKKAAPKKAETKA